MTKKNGIAGIMVNRANFLTDIGLHYPHTHTPTLMHKVQKEGERKRE